MEFIQIYKKCLLSGFSGRDIVAKNAFNQKEKMETRQTVFAILLANHCSDTGNDDIFKHGKRKGSRESSTMAESQRRRNHSARQNHREEKPNHREEITEECTRRRYN